MKSLSMYEQALVKQIEFVLQSISEKPSSFDDLCRRCLGAFPTEIFSHLSNEHQRLFRTNRYKGLKEIKSFIPESNPVNFDWRFNKRTQEILVNEILDPYDKIALFGVPSLFQSLKLKNKTVWLFDVNSVLKYHFKDEPTVHIVDINSPKFECHQAFDCIVFDCPWYLDYYYNWINQAIKCLLPGGTIYTSLFQQLLRPTAYDDRSQVMKILSHYGTIDISVDLLLYNTPLFEMEVFNHYNIPIVNDWRVADLVTITNIRLSHSNKLRQIENEWIRFEIGTQTVAIKHRYPNSSIKIQYPYQSDDNLLKTVSVNDDVRKTVNFITSRNRGLIVKGTAKVVKILEALSNGVDIGDIEKMMVLSSDELIEFNKLLKAIMQ